MTGNKLYCTATACKNLLLYLLLFSKSHTVQQEAAAAHCPPVMTAKIRHLHWQTLCVQRLGNKCFKLLAHRFAVMRLKPVIKGKGLQSSALQLTYSHVTPRQCKAEGILT